MQKHGASPFLDIPPYVDALTQTFYNALCRALALRQRSGTAQRAIELELRLGNLKSRDSHISVSSSAAPRIVQPMEPLTPAVLLANEMKGYTFSPFIAPQVAAQVEARIMDLAARHTKRTRRCTAANVPSVQVMVTDASTDARLLYERTLTSSRSSSPSTPRREAHYVLCAWQQKRSVDALDVRCREWLADMRLAMACEDTLDAALLSDPQPLADAPLNDFVCGNMQLRLRRCAQVTPYVTLDVTHQGELFAARRDAVCPYTFGRELTPLPPTWGQYGGLRRTRVEAEFNLPRVYRDWCRAVGSKSVHAVLQRYIDDKQMNFVEKTDQESVNQRQQHVRVPHDTATGPLDPFLRALVEETLAVVQFVLKLN